MSLDISLKGATREVECMCPNCDHKHSKMETEIFWSGNCTHNLTEMAQAAKLYKPIWRPEEVGITTAKQLIEPLEKGLKKLIEYPNKFKKYNPSNGWGSYDSFVQFVSALLLACKNNPEATIDIWR